MTDATPPHPCMTHIQSNLANLKNICRVSNLCIPTLLVGFWKFTSGYRGMCMSWGKFLKEWQVKDKITEWIFFLFTFNFLQMTQTQEIITCRVSKIHAGVGVGWVMHGGVGWVMQGSVMQQIHDEKAESFLSTAFWSWSKSKFRSAGYLIWAPIQGYWIIGHWI